MTQTERDALKVLGGAIRVVGEGAATAYGEHLVETVKQAVTGRENPDHARNVLRAGAEGAMNGLEAVFSHQSR
ncbi:MAG: hypothetical protein ACKV2Q_14695 [Planctomycetaceae bacterium]